MLGLGLGLGLGLELGLGLRVYLRIGTRGAPERAAEPKGSLASAAEPFRFFKTGLACPLCTCTLSRLKKVRHAAQHHEGQEESDRRERGVLLRR